MAIRGDLLSVDLSNVFQMLALNRKRGILQITNRENVLEKRSLILEEDRVSLLDLPEEGELDGYLLDLGVLGYEDYTDNRLQARRFGLYPTEYLYKRGGIDYSIFDRARSHAQEELILEIFLWRNVAFCLDEDAKITNEGEDKGRTRFSVDQIVMEAARRQDEWERIRELLGTAGNDVFAPTRADQHEGIAAMDDVTRVVYDYLDGVRGTREIMLATVLPRYQVDAAISKLVEADFARKQRLDALIVNGDRLTAEGRVDDAIRLFKCAVRYDRKSVVIHKRLASAFLSEARIAKAAAHLKFCAIAVAERGNLVEAYGTWREVVRVLPTDFKAIESCLDIRGKIETPLTGDDQEIVDLGVRLFNLWYDLKFYEKAERVVTLVLALIPEDTGLMLSLARVHGKLGKISAAVETYMKVAGRLFDREDFEGAINAYKAVISYDLSNKNICHQRIQEIRDLVDRRRKRKVAGIVFLAIAVAVVGAVAAYWLYHRSGMTRYDAAVAAEAAAKDETSLQSVMRELADIRSSYPLTQAARVAEQRRREVNARILDLQQRVDEERRAFLDAQEIEFLEAQELYRKAVVKQRNLELTEALELLRQAVAKAEALKRGRWVKSEHLDELLESLERHVSTENGQLEAWRSAHESGDFRAAHAAAQKLIEPQDVSSLDATRIRLVSESTRRSLRVPFALHVVPAGAAITIDGIELTSEQRIVELDAERTHCVVEAKAPGYRPLRIDIDWSRSSFDQRLVLVPEASASFTAGDRLHRVFVRGDAWFVVSGGGRVARYGADGVEPMWSTAPPVLVNIDVAEVVASGHLVLSSPDGRAWAVDLSNGKVLWNRRVRMTTIASRGAACFVTIADDSPRVAAIDVSSGEERWSNRCSLDARVRDGDDRFVVLEDAPGRFQILDAASGSLITEFVGRPDAPPLVDARGVAVIADGRMRWYADDCKTVVREIDHSSLPARVVPFGDGRRLIVGTDGRWMSVDESGEVHDVPPSDSRIEVRSGTKVTPVHGSNLVLVADRDGRSILVDLESGEMTSAFGGEQGVISACRLANRLWIAYTGADGRLDRHDIHDP